MGKYKIGLCLLAVLILPIFAIPFFAVPVDSPYRPYWFGPTHEFQYQDINRDGEISRAESEYWALQTNLLSNSGSVRPFIYADCDENGRLTWREYYNFRFTNDRQCAQEISYRSVVQDMSSQYRNDKYPFPFILTDSHTVYTSPDVTDYTNYDLFEDPIEPSKHSGIDIDCGDITFGLVPEHLEIYESSPVQYVDCKLGNQLGNLTITSFLLEISYSDFLGPINSANLKSANIPPNGSKPLRIYLSSGANFESVRVIEARGMSM